MTKSLLITSFLLISILSHSQSNEPKIGTEKCVKEEYDDTDFDSDEEESMKRNKDKNQAIRISYSKSYFSGTFRNIKIIITK